MNEVNSVDDSHEPMEIEEISYTESAEVSERMNIQKEKDTEDVKSPGNLRPKIILRESKLTNVLEGPKTTDAGIKNDENETPKNELKEMKSKLRPLIKKEKMETKEREKSNFFYFWQTMFFVLFPIAVIVASVSIARDEFDAYDCDQRFNFTDTIRGLETRIFGQPQAIRALGFHLGINFSRFKVLAIIGGTGVGKSYAAHIMGENFPWKKNVFQFVPPFKNSRLSYAARALSTCGCNLIIIENLHNRDILDAAIFVEDLKTAIGNDRYCLFVLNVINIQETDDNLKHDVDLDKSTDQILKLYETKGLDVNIVRFEPLDDEVVTKCIIHEAGKRNLTLSQSEINEIRISLRNADSGCKGARAKVQLLDK